MEDKSTFWDHLEVLRWALFRVVCVVILCMVGTFLTMPYIFDQYILAPTTGNFFVYQWLSDISNGLFTFNPNYSVDIININVTSQFLTHIKTSISLALVISFPYLVFEVWKFIRPALFEYEVKRLRFIFCGSTIMFYIGCLVAYLLIFPFTFRFLTEYELSSHITNQIDLSSYIGTFTMLIMIMGIVFEMPILAWLLSCFGIINKQILKRFKREAIVAMLILSAIITPSGDPFTLLLVFAPLYLLYELSILVVKS